MGGSSAEKNAVFEFLHFGETSSAASEVSPGGRNHGGRNPFVSPVALPLADLRPKEPLVIVCGEPVNSHPT
jgi:hypothetical protein